MSIRVTSAPGTRAHRNPTSAPTTPAPTTAIGPDGIGSASQIAFSAVSMFAAITPREIGTSFGTGTAASAGTSKTVWCGMEGEHVAANQGVRPGLDTADRRVTVLHRERKASAHKGATHPLVLARGHFPAAISASVPRLMAP